MTLVAKIVARNCIECSEKLAAQRVGSWRIQQIEILYDRFVKQPATQDRSWKAFVEKNNAFFIESLRIHIITDV